MLNDEPGTENQGRIEIGEGPPPCGTFPTCFHRDFPGFGPGRHFGDQAGGRGGIYYGADASELNGIFAGGRAEPGSRDDHLCAFGAGCGINTADGRLRAAISVPISLRWIGFIFFAAQRKGYQRPG